MNRGFKNGLHTVIKVKNEDIKITTFIVIQTH